ncbi:MAG: FecCD family ABC transporter permease [Acidimicrobiales bacterium]
MSQLTVRAERLDGRWLLASVVVLFGAAFAGVVIGPANLPVADVLKELLDRLPLVSVENDLTTIGASIVWEVRLPRVLLGALVGASLSISGAGYQAVFRNPLADPYLLGAAAGAGLGATIAIVADLGDGSGILDAVPVLAFVGAMAAVMMSWSMGRAGDAERSPAALLLAGVAVASFLTAVQSFVLQRNADDFRRVFSWIFGRLNVASWSEVWLLGPYVVACSSVILLYRRQLDVMRVGDMEAESLGVRPSRVRGVIIVAASLCTAAAVAVSGLIGFVGIIVPHFVRLAVGTSNRIVLPLSIVFGAGFMVATDLVARTALAPSEVPIGVVTAFFGAPFFVVVLRTSRRAFG